MSKSFIPSLLPSESTYRAPGKYQGPMPGAKVQAERWTGKSLEHPGVKSCEQSTRHRSHLWCKKETAPWPPPTFSALTSLMGFFRQARPTCGFTWPQPAKGYSLSQNYSQAVRNSQWAVLKHVRVIGERFGSSSKKRDSPTEKMVKAPNWKFTENNVQVIYLSLITGVLQI